jgi:hypothetical protein
MKMAVQQTRMNHETCRDNEPASHVGRRQLVLELEIGLLLSSAPPHGVLVIIVQIAENGNNEDQKNGNC